MAYRIRYAAWVDWIGPGSSVMTDPVGPLSGPVGGSGNAQTKAFFNTQNFANTNIQGTGAGGIIQAADITTLTNAIAADISAQMNAQPALGQLQGFASGGG